MATNNQNNKTQTKLSTQTKTIPDDDQKYGRKRLGGWYGIISWIPT